MALTFHYEVLQMDEMFKDGAKIAKAIAVESYKAGDLSGAKEYAARARILDPELAGVRRLNAVLDLMIGFQRKIGGEPDWYAVLSVEPTADAATIKDSYRKLFLDIVMDDEDDSVGSIDQAKKILVESWKFLCDENRKRLYDQRRRDASQALSLTYVPVVLSAQRVFDPPRIFEVKAEEMAKRPLRIFGPVNQSRRGSQFPSLTYNLAPKPAAKSPKLFDLKAEVKAEQVVQQRGGGSKRKTPPLTNVIHHLNQLRRLSKDSEIRAIERRGRNLMDTDQDVVRRALAEKAKSMIKNLGFDAAKIALDEKRLKRECMHTNDLVVKDEADQEFISVPDADFYNFDGDRIEALFGENQVWAAYDDNDGMPRFYALVHRVISREPLKLCLSWLTSNSNEEIGPMKWVDSGFHKTCGRFSIGRRGISEYLINSFSHRVQLTEGENNFVQIYPKKGDVWALYANWSPSWGCSTPEEVVYKYEMVEVIQDFDKERGVVAVAPLVKVPGFKTVFRRLPDHKTFPGKELFRFSHQVASRLLTGQEGENAPEGCLELDSAAMSPELLKVFTEEEMENVNKNPKEEVGESSNNEAVEKPKEEVGETSNNEGVEKPKEEI